MIKKIITVILLVVLVSIAISCSGGGNNDGNPIKATWIEPQIAGDTVSIPVEEVTKKTNVHFRIPTNHGNISFMAYEIGDEIFVRSNICPPCRSSGFSLAGDILVCDNCGTTFGAKSGAGIQGACVAYPKASVPYTITDGRVGMKGDDLIKAHNETVNPG